MKKLLLLLLINLSFSQNNGGTATYILNVAHNEKFDKLPDRYKDFLNKQEIDADGTLFKLNFSSINSLFGVQEIENKEKIRAFCISSQTIYNDSISIFFNNSSSTFIDIKENQYLIEDNKNYKWELTQETKTIQGYTCFKATCTYLYETKMPENITVTAWYCPKIPYNFGPNGFYGLPGLILELHNRNTVFGIKKLVFNEKEVILEKPKLGELISKINYDKMNKEKTNELVKENEKRR